MTAFVSSLYASLTKRRLTPQLALAAGAVLVGTICGRLAISHYGTAAIELLIGVPLIVLIARRPLLATVVLLAVVSSVIAYGQLPRLNVPGHPPINLGDVCLAAAVGGTLWRRPWRAWPRLARLYFLAVIGFLLLAAVATVKTSLLGYAQSRGALSEYVNWLYLAAALTVVVELAGGLRKPFLDAMIALAALVACLSVAAAASHSVANALTGLSPSESPVTVESGSALTQDIRVRVVGLYFAYSMCIPTLVMVLLVKDRGRLLRATALVLMLAAVGLSLNRNMYLGLVAGLLLTALLGGSALRVRLVSAAAVLFTCLVLVAVTSAVPGVASAIGQRASTALSPAVTQSNSLQDRFYEFRVALPTIARHPWFGVGPNQFYGAFGWTQTGQRTPLVFVQDLYLYIATDYGIPAALAFLSIPFFCLFLGAARLRHAITSLDRALLAGSIGTVVALLLSLVVGTYLQTPESTVAFAVSLGFLLTCVRRTYEPPLPLSWSANA